jgi:hypothetical protein
MQQMPEAIQLTPRSRECKIGTAWLISVLICLLSAAVYCKRL